MAGENSEEGIQTLKNNAEQVLKNITDILTEIEGKKKAFVESISDIEKVAKEQVKVIEDYNKRIFEGVDGAASIQAEINGFSKSVTDTLESLKKRELEIKERTDEFFGVKDENGILNGGILNGTSDTTFQKLSDETSKYTKEQRDRFNELFKKIEGLLPGATSAGLAKAYQENKRGFEWPNYFWSLLFIGTIAIMTWLGYTSFKEFSIEANISFSLVLAHLISRLPFLLPLIWLAFMANKQQSQNKRLAQEYAHKESLAKSYEGYKRQIESLGEASEKNQILGKLTMNLVDMTADNPSQTLEKIHGDQPPFVSQILDRFLPSKKDQK